MPRVLILLAATLLIVWQGGCLTVRDGMLINRCGLWQFVTGRQIIFAVRELPQPAVQSVPQVTMSPPIVIYQGSTTNTMPMVTSSGMTLTYGGHAATMMTLGP